MSNTLASLHTCGTANSLVLYETRWQHLMCGSVVHLHYSDLSNAWLSCATPLTLVMPAMLPISIQTILAAVPLILVAQAQQTCYSINGNPDTTMSPCNASAAHSGCCYANEYCLTNGLCINQALVGGNRLSRVGCTDKNVGRSSMLSGVQDRHVRSK